MDNAKDSRAAYSAAYAEKWKYLTFRLSGDLYERFAAFCNRLDISPSRATEQFILRFLDGEIPLVIGGTANVYEGASVRTGLRIRRETAAAFAEKCAELAMPMSNIIRDFMRGCVAAGKLPFDYVIEIDGRKKCRDGTEGQVQKYSR